MTSSLLARRRFPLGMAAFLPVLLAACGGGSGEPSSAAADQQAAVASVSDDTAALAASSAIDQVIADMSSPSEALVIDPRYNWQRQPQVTMAAPRGDAIPSWWSGNRPTWTSAVLSWFTAFEAQGNQASNTRVHVKNLRFYVLSQATRTWTLVDSSTTPAVNLWSYPFDWAAGASGAGLRNESDGGVSMKPVYPKFHHGWANAKAINPQDVRAVFATIDFRLVLDNANGADDRASAKYVVDAGADYYPDMGLKWSLNYAPGIGNGRMLLATKDWRSATLLVPNPNYGSTMEEMRSNPPPLSTAGPGTPVPPAPPGTLPVGSTVLLKAKHSAKCLNVSGYSTNNGARLIQWTCDAGAANEQFKLKDMGGAAYAVVSNLSGRCLDVSGYSTAAGAAIQQYTCGSGSNQRWSVSTESDGYRVLKGLGSGLCLTIAGGATGDGAALQQAACVAGNASQRFLIQ